MDMETAKLDNTRGQAVLAAFKQAKKDKQLIMFAAYVFSIYYLEDASETSLIKPKSIAQLMENIDILREHFPAKKKSSNKSIPARMPGGAMPLDNGSIYSAHLMFFLKDFLTAWAVQKTDDVYALQCLESFIEEKLFFPECIHAISILYDEVKYLTPGRGCQMLDEDVLGIRHVLNVLQDWAARSGYGPLALMTCLVESYTSVFPEAASRVPVETGEASRLLETIARRAAELSYEDFEHVLYYFFLPRVNDADGVERAEHIRSIVSAVAEQMRELLPDDSYTAAVSVGLTESLEVVETLVGPRYTLKKCFFAEPSAVWITLSAYAAIQSADSDVDKEKYALQWAEAMSDIKAGPGRGGMAAAKWQLCLDNQGNDIATEISTGP